MTASIELRSMRFYAYHGLSEQERTVGNHFVVDVLLTAPLQQAIASDSIHDTINYATVYRLVQAEMEIPSNLLEHVAGRILFSLKRNFSQITRIELKLSKQSPPFQGDVHSAAVILKESY